MDLAALAAILRGIRKVKWSDRFSGLVVSISGCVVAVTVIALGVGIYNGGGHPGWSAMIVVGGAVLGAMMILTGIDKACKLR